MDHSALNSKRSRHYGLALHTTTPELGLALSDFATEHRCQVWDLGRALSTHLHSHLAEFLQPQTWDDLAWLAVAQGPGGFTGTRIGVVTARTLAQQLDLPLFAISTLAALAWSAPVPEKIAIAVQMPAQRGEIFGGIYTKTSGRLIPLVPDAVFTPDKWQHILTSQTTKTHILEAEPNLGASVRSILTLAHQAWQQGQRPLWSEALPFYGQHPVV